MAILLLFDLSLPVTHAANTGDRGKIISRGEDGSVCYEADAREADAFYKKLEAMVNAGKHKEAFDAAEKDKHGCLEDLLERKFSIINRTYKTLGQQSEKAGKPREAFTYYYYPFLHYYSLGLFREHEKQYSLNDAHRTMLAHAKSKPDDLKVITEAVQYFEIWEQRPIKNKELLSLVERGGKKQLENEDLAFTKRKYENALGSLDTARRWFSLIDIEKPIQDRARQRVDKLILLTSYDDIEQAMNYAAFHHPSTDVVRTRAGKLGAEAERKGDLELAHRFYFLAGDTARADAVSDRQNKMLERKEREAEQKETKRQKKFQDDQKSLEKELGL